MRAEGFFRRTAGSITVQDKQGTHEQPVPFLGIGELGGPTGSPTSLG